MEIQPTGEVYTSGVRQDDDTLRLSSCGCDWPKAATGRRLVNCVRGCICLPCIAAKTQKLGPGKTSSNDFGRRGMGGEAYIFPP
jgi:hypothetical protein